MCFPSPQPRSSTHLAAVRVCRRFRRARLGHADSGFVKRSLERGLDSRVFVVGLEKGRIAGHGREYSKGWLKSLLSLVGS
jgi:hypothetical protein